MQYNVTTMNYTGDNQTWGEVRVTNDTTQYMSYHYPPLSPAVVMGRRFLSTTGNILGVVSILLNVAFLLAVHFFKDKKTAYFRLIRSLAISDLFASLSFIITQNWPHGPFASINPRQHYVLMHGLIYVFRGTPWMFFTAYQLTLCSLTLNQWVAVCRPLCYTEVVTSKKVTVCMVIIWCLSSLQIIVPLLIVLVLCQMDNRTDAMRTLYYISTIEIHFWMVFFVITIFFNIAFNLCIYVKIRRLKMRTNFSSTIESQSLHMKHEAFITLSLLLAASFCCRLPFPLMSFIGLNIEQMTLSYSTIELIDAFVLFLLYVNFVVDPIIYVVRTKDVRKTYASLLNACSTKLRCCCLPWQGFHEPVRSNERAMSRTMSTCAESYFMRKMSHMSHRSTGCQTEDDKELHVVQEPLVSKTDVRV